MITFLANLRLLLLLCLPLHRSDPTCGYLLTSNEITNPTILSPAFVFIGLVPEDPKKNSVGRAVRWGRVRRSRAEEGVEKNKK